MSNIYREPSIDASYHVSVHLAKNCLWLPCLLTDQEEMCTLYREHSIDASYQVLVYLVYLTKVVSEEKIFLNQPIKKKLPVAAIFINESGRNVLSL